MGWDKINAALSNPVGDAAIGAGVGFAVSGGNPIGALAGAGVGLGVSSIFGAETNYQNQRDIFNYQKNLQQQIFQREDNSIQRRVADLKAAGLSPVLAAGQGAGTGGIVSMTAPQRENAMEKMLQLANMYKMSQDISLTNAQVDLVKAQEAKAIEETKGVPAQIEKMRADSYKTWQEGKSAKVLADVQSKTGNPGTSTIGKTLNDVTGSIMDAWNTYNNAVNNTVDNVKKEINKKMNNQSKPRSNQPQKQPKYKGSSEALYITP